MLEPGRRTLATTYVPGLIVSGTFGPTSSTTPKFSCPMMRKLWRRGGDVAGRSQRARPVRGPLVAADLDLPDPDQHREDARSAGRAHAAVLGAAGAGPRARGGGRRRPLPRPGASALARPLGPQAG